MIVTDGVVRLGSPLVNWYLVEGDGGVTVVDAGVSGYRPQLEGGLAELGRRPEDVRAVVLTYAHVDHVGVAEMLRAELGIAVHVHEADRELATTAKTTGKNERSFLPYLRHAMAWRLLFHLARNGGLKPRPIAEVETFVDGQELPVPGRPVVLRTPGHTDGHCALWFSGRRCLLVGDALCTLNPLTGAVGPPAHAGRLQPVERRVPAVAVADRGGRRPRASARPRRAMAAGGRGGGRGGTAGRAYLDD